MFNILRGAWRYRHFVVSAIRSEFATRFARSRLGGLWMILNPLAHAAILAFVLSSVLAAKLPGIDSQYGFALHMMSGMLCWSLFQETVTRCLTVFIDNGNLLKKLVFPRICLPLVVAGSALLANLLLLLAMLAVFLVLAHLPGVQALWLLPLAALTLALALGLGLSLGVLNVFLRDVGQVVPIILQFGFWLTPVAYAPSMVPQQYRSLLAANPLHPLVSAYQRVLVHRLAPDFLSLLPVVALTLVLLALALVLFRRASPDMVDVL